MSLLLGTEIIENVENNRVNIIPFNQKHVGPNSYDVTLNKLLKTYYPSEIIQTESGEHKVLVDVNNDNFIDAATHNKVYELRIPQEGLILEPGVLYLGATNEIAGSDFFIPMYEGRSSLARLGIESHISAGFGDIGFKSNWTLEITVVHPVKVYPDMRIGQVYFHKVDESAREELFSQTKHYTGKYNGQVQAQESKSYLDFLKTK